MRGASAACRWRATAPFVAVMLLMLCAIAPMPSSSDTGRAGSGTEVSGSITVDANWSIGQGPFIVTDDISVSPGATLSITSGSFVKFEKGTKMTIMGTILATDVHFVSNEQVPAPGDWNGLIFLSADGANSTLAGAIIEHPTTGINLMSTDMVLSGLSVTEFSQNGVSIGSGVTATVMEGTFESSGGSYAISAHGTVKVQDSTINAQSGIDLGGGLQTVDNNRITVRQNGIKIGSAANCEITNNVIYGNGEGTFGISISDSSAVYDVTMNDISGFGSGIFIGAEALGTISRDNIHTNRDFGINSQDPVTVTDCYFGRVPALIDDVPRPSDGTSPVTASGTRAFPYEIENLEQPPIVVITSHKGQDIVKGIVNVTGHAYEADMGWSIEKVEYKVQNGTSGENLTDWTAAKGTVDWSVAWDTRGLAPNNSYQLWVRAEADDDGVGITAMTLMAKKEDTGGGGGGGGGGTNNTNGTGDGNGGKDGDATVLGLPPLVFWSIMIVMMAVAVGAFVAVYNRSRKEEEVRRKALKDLQAQWLTAVQQGMGQGPSVAIADPPASTGGVGMEGMIIEDVFLIYKDGRLLNHDGRRLRPEMDDDMLVGMFTAIQEFIKGAFPSDSDDPTKNIVNEITRGDEKVLIEHGKFVYLAVVVRAADTTKVHARMRDVIAAIETDRRGVLEKWDGNMAVTGDLKPYTKGLIMEPF